MTETEGNKNRTALVMEGGAMRGMFTCGVTDVFMENGVTFDGAAGISAMFNTPVAGAFFAMEILLPKNASAIPAIIPLVPGGTLYYAMSFAVHGELEQARSYGMRALLSALAIAGGISLVTVLRELRTRR